MSSTPPRSELQDRLYRFQGVLERRKVSAALITNDRNVRYLSGFAGGDSALLITPKKRFLLTDFRYVEEAAVQAPGWEVVIEKEKPARKGPPKVIVPHGLMEKAGHIAKKNHIKLMAVEPGDLRLADMRALRRATKGATHIRAEDAMVAELRIFKSTWEIEQIEVALRIQEAAFKALCKTTLKAGVTEREAAAYLRYLMVKAGAEDQAFEIMVQFGANASLPHGRPTDTRMKAATNVLLDWGCRYNGYHSDLTRSFFIGTIPRRLHEIHQVVLAAQRAAIEKIAPGVTYADVDRAARDLIEKAGYGKAFGHSTGHGIGLNIHEQPSLSWRREGELRAGMVVTVEPGIYLPGVGGVRIEDDVLVTPNGGRILSRLEKGLRWDGSNH